MKEDTNSLRESEKDLLISRIRLNLQKLLDAKGVAILYDANDTFLGSMWVRLIVQDVMEDFNSLNNLK